MSPEKTPTRTRLALAQKMRFLESQMGHGKPNGKPNGSNLVIYGLF